MKKYTLAAFVGSHFPGRGTRYDLGLVTVEATRFSRAAKKAHEKFMAKAASDPALHFIFRLGWSADVRYQEVAKGNP